MNKCKHGGCDKRIKALGLCSFHYYRLKAGASLDAPKWFARGPLECSIEECVEDAIARKLCQVHYRRLMSGRDMGAPIVKQKPNGVPESTLECSIEWCTTPRMAKGLCSMHRWRKKHGKDMNKPPKGSEGWVGEPYPNGDGYMFIAYRPVGGETVFTGHHRYVMSKRIGRELLPHETVHHINGVRDDNRIENLELWSSSHPRGQRVEDKTGWAIEMLETYADLLDTEHVGKLESIVKSISVQD